MCPHCLTACRYKGVSSFALEPRSSGGTTHSLLETNSDNHLSRTSCWVFIETRDSISQNRREMRLLHTNTQKLVEKTPEELRKDNVRYAILSHTWGSNEVIYDDIVHGTAWAKNPNSLRKVQGACHQARSDGYDYIWIDTCCIDKSSSAELSEAINSSKQLLNVI